MAASASPDYDSYEEQQLLQVPQINDDQEDQVVATRDAALRQRVLGGYAGENDTAYQPSPQATVQAIGGPPAAPLLSPPTAPPSPPDAAPPDTVVGPSPAAPAPANDGWATPKDAAPGSGPISVWGPEDVQPEAKPGIGSEMLGGAVRGLAHMGGEAGRLLGTAMRKTGQWTEQQWLQEGAKAVDDFSTQTEEAAAKKYPLGSMSMKDAYDKGQIWPWIAGKASEQVLPIGAILGMAKLTGPFGPILYGALVGANEEARKDDATPQSIASGSVMGAASMGLPLGIAKAVQGQGLLTRVLGGIAGFAGLGAAGTFEEPVQKVVRGGQFEAPTRAQVLEGAVVSAPAGALAAFGTGARARQAPPPTADTRPPAVDPAVATATRLALPPPSPENRAPLGLPAPTLENRPPTPDVINVPPEGGQVSSADIIPPPAGTVDRPPIPGLDPDVAAAAQQALPAPSLENRPPPTLETRPTIPVPPEAGQVSSADIVPPGTGFTMSDAGDMGIQQRPSEVPGAGFTMRNAGESGLQQRPSEVRGGAQGELPGVEPPPPQGELPLRQPPRAPVTERLPDQPSLPLEEQPSLPFKLADPTGWRVEPDDATPGQFVVKHGDDVLAVGSSPEEAMRIAHERAQRASVAPRDVRATTGSEAPGTVASAAAAPPPAAVEAPVTGAAAARATRRAQMKPAAQEVLAKAEEAKQATAPTGMPSMITNAMKRQLSDRGHTSEEIRNMTPGQAHEILSKPAAEKPAPAVAAAEKPQVAELLVKRAAAPDVTPHETAVHELPSGKFGVTVNGEAAGVKTGYSTREQAQAIADRARQLSSLPQWNDKPVATLVAKAANIENNATRRSAATRAEIEARTPSTQQFRNITERIKADIDAKRQAQETPAAAARRARISREVAADLAEARETPASAKPAARGMENIQDIPEAQADVEPTRTSTAVPVEEGSELKSGQMAASTTSLELKASKLLEDILENPDKMDVVKAHDAYGEPSGKGGHPRTHDTFLDFLKSRIARAQDPNALNDIIARARAISEDTTLSPAAKRRASDAIGKEIDRLGNEQDNLPELLNMHDELRQELARRESRAGRTTRESDSEAALREMEEANKKPGRLRSEDTDRPITQSHAHDTEVLPDVNLPVWDLAHESAQTGVAHDLHDYLDRIIANPTARGLTPHLVALARVLKKIVGRGVQVTGHYDLGAQGDYHPPTNSIRINVDADSTVRTILHEGLHAGTAHFMEHIRTKISLGQKLTPDERRTYRGLDAVAKEIDRLRQNPDATIDELDRVTLARQSHDELITYALTSPHLLDLMARTDASPELIRAMRQLGLAPDGKRPSVFAAFKRAIGQIFGIGKEQTSVLDAVLRPLTEAVERGAEFKRSIDTRPDDLRDASGLRVFERTGKLTDGLPDAALREKLSEFGDKVATFNEGGLRSDDTAMGRMWTRARREAAENLGGGVLQADRGTTTVVKRPHPIAEFGESLARHAGGGARWMRSVLLPASTTDQIVRYNRDVLPEAAAIRDARAKQAATTLDVHAQWNDRVREWVNQLKRAGDQFEDLRNRISMAQADVLHPDFEAANAHLKPGDALNRARALKTEFDALPDDQKQLHRELRDYHLETGWAERQADFEYLVHRALGDRVTPEERAELARLARSKPKLDQMIANPDGSDLAALMAERWPAARNVVKAVAELQRKGWMEGNYTPLQRHGDYIVSYGEPNTEGYGVHFFDTNNKAEAFRADFIAKNPGIEVSPVKQKATTGSNRYQEFMPNTMLPELKRSLELRGIKGDDADGFLDAYAGMLLQRGAQSSAARLNVQRRNVIGASADGARNLVRDLSVHASRMGFLHNAADEHQAYLQADKRVRQLGQGRTPGTAEDIKASRERLDKLETRFADKDPAVSRDEIIDARQQHKWLEKPPSSDDVQRVAQVFDELKMRRTPVDGDDSSRIFGTIARRFTGTSFVFHLMRPAHLAVQVLDAMSNAQSSLGGSYGNVRAAAALSRALMQLAPEGMRAGGRNMFNAVHGSMKQSDWMLSRVLEKRLVATGMHPDEARALIQVANDRGLIDHSLEREMQRLAHPGGFGFGGDAATLPGRYAGHMMDLFAAGEHAVDALNRTAILKAGYDLAKRQNGGRLNDGTVDAAALRAAIEHASEAMPNYGIWNKPRIATERGPIKNPLVAATMQYKIYGMHMYSWMGSLVKEAATRPGPERAAALKTLAGLMATHSLLIGATAQMFGVPVNVMTGLWDLIHGEKGPHNYENDVRRSMTSMFGPTASTILSRGVLGLAGVDLHRSLKTSNMVDIPEMRTFDRAGVGAFFATGITGASGEVAQQLTDAAHQMFAGNFSRAAMEMTPRMVGDVLKAHQLATEGMVDPRGNVIRKPSLLAPSTPYLRGLGFNPMDTALVYDRRSAEQEHANEIENARSRAEDRYVQSKGRDLSAVRAYNANKAFNQGDTIEMPDLQNAVKRAQGRLQRPETYGLQFSKKQLPGALAAGRFN